MPRECGSSDGGSSCCQYAGNRFVVFVSLAVAAQGGIVPP